MRMGDLERYALISILDGRGALANSAGVPMAIFLQIAYAVFDISAQTVVVMDEEITTILGIDAQYAREMDLLGGIHNHPSDFGLE